MKDEKKQLLILRIARCAAVPLAGYPLCGCCGVEDTQRWVGTSGPGSHKERVFISVCSSICSSRLQLTRAKHGNSFSALKFIFDASSCDPGRSTSLTATTDYRHVASTKRRRSAWANAPRL